MAFDYKKAREAGYSDAEIADHLSTEVGFDTKAARKAGYTDTELASHLVGQYSIKNDNSFTDKLSDAAGSVADTVKGGLTSIYSKVSDLNLDPAAAAQEKQIRSVAATEPTAAAAPVQAPAVEQPAAAPEVQKEYQPSTLTSLKQKALRGVSNAMGDITSATGLEVPFQEDVSNELRRVDSEIAANKEAFRNLKTQDELVQMEPAKKLTSKPAKAVKEQAPFVESDFAKNNPITSALIASVPTTASGLIKGTLINVNEIANSEQMLSNLLAVPGGAQVTTDEQGNVTSNYKPENLAPLIDPNNNEVNKYLDESAQYFTSRISRETAADALNNGELGTWAAVVTAQQFPQLAMLVGSALTRNPELANTALNMMGVSSAGNTYGELIKSGVSQTEANLIGTAQGLIEKYTEKMGFDFIGDAAGKAMSKAFGQQYLGALATGATKAVAIGGATEFGEEFSGAIGSDVIANRVANVGLMTEPDNQALQNIADKSFSDTFDNAINQGFAGMAGGGLIGAGFAYSSAKAEAEALNPQDPVLARLAGGISVGVHEQLNDANLQAVRDVALRHNMDGAAAEVISAVDAELFRRQNMGTMERAEAEATWAQNPINQALGAATQSAPPAGTMSEATAAAPVEEAAPAELDPALVQENVFDPTADITPEQLPALDPEQRTAWATSASPKSVIATLKGLPTQQAKIDAVESLQISDAAKAKLHKDLGNDKVEAATFQDIDAADRQLLEELNAQQTTAEVELPNEQTNITPLRDLDPATDYAGYIQALDGTLASTEARTQERTGQAPFRVQPINPEQAQAVTPLVEAIEEAFGSSVVPFSATEKTAPDGFALNGRAHVNVANLDRAVAFVVGHEFGHTMETSDDPADQQTAQWLRENLIPMISEQGQRDYAELFLTKGLGPDGANLTLEQVNADPELRDMLESEMVQDFLGKRMTDRKFLNTLAKRDPSGFVDFVQKWIAALDKMIKSLSGKKALGVQDIDKYIKDLTQAKNLASTALIQWRANAKARQGKAAAQSPVDVDGVVGEIQFAKKDSLPTGKTAVELENRTGVIVGARPGEFDWTFSSGKVPPPIAHPVQFAPRIEQLGDGMKSIIESKGAAKLFDELFGLKKLKVFPTLGSYKGKPEPSMALYADGITFVQADGLSKLLGFAFAQESTIVTQPVYAGDQDTWPAYYTGNGKKMTSEEVSAARSKAAELGLDYTTSIDGKYFKFFDDGSDNFDLKVKQVQEAAGFKQIKQVETRSTFNESENYTQATDQGRDRQDEQEDRGGASWARRPDLFRRTVDQLLIPYARLVASEGYRLDPERFGERFGLNEEQVAYIGEQLRPKSGKGLSTAAIMAGTEELDVAKSGRGGKSSVTDVLWALQNRAGKVGQISIYDRSTDAQRVLAEAIADEVVYHIKQHAGKSAIGWYDTALTAAKKQYHSVFPELETDANAEMMFDAILGIASQGADVHTNSVNGSRVYSQYREGKAIPEIVKQLKGSFGKETRAIEANLLKLHELVDRNGFDTMRTLFNEKKTVGEWNATLRTDPRLKWAGLQVAGAAEQTVNGWMVFGPKIGSFINNLHGDYSTLTADLWFSRTWNRMLGFTFLHTPAQEADKYVAFKDALVAEATKSTEPKRVTSTGKASYWNHGNDVTEADVVKIINDPDAMLAKAYELEEVFRKGGYKVKSDLRRAAKNWIEFRADTVAAPRNDTERFMQQQTVERAARMIRARTGDSITIADIQAALWFHEKELFAKFGAASERAKPADYADAAKATVAMIRSGTLYGSRQGNRNGQETESTPAFSRKQTGLDQRGSEGAADAAKRAGEGAVRVNGTHYSNQQRQSLDGRFYGTGIKGAEQTRVIEAKDRRLRSRLYFYVDEGKGVKPEPGVGKFAHNVDLTNLYDTSTRKLTWEKDPYGDNAVTMNNFESAVLNAGYSGYYRPEAFGTQGVAVLLGDAAVGVKPKDTPAFSRKWTEVSQMVMINEIAKNKKDWGRHLSSAQIKMVDQEQDEGFKAKNASQRLNAAYLTAAQQKDAYDNYLKAIAEKLNLVDKVPGLKGRKRTVEKLIADYNSDVDKLKDMLRGTIETESLAQARELYEALREVAPLADVAGNDKSSLDPSKPAASEAGYRDAKLILDVNGVPAELIIAPAALLRAKDIAHELYEEQRTLMAQEETATPARSLKLRERIIALNEKMFEIYAPAVERSQSSSASLRVHGTELSRELGVLSGLLSGSNANLRLYGKSVPSGGSATAMPSKLKNLVPSGKSANGDLAMVSTSEKDIIPQGKEIKFSRKQTETPEFKKWFGDSKVVDENGQPLVVYHGTPDGSFEAFDPAAISDKTLMLQQGPGFYFTDKANASRYKKSVNKSASGKPRLYDVYLSLQKPLLVSDSSGLIPKEAIKRILLEGDYPWFFDSWIPFESGASESLSKEDKVDAYLDNLAKGKQGETDTTYLKNLVRAFKDKEALLASMRKHLNADGVIFNDWYGKIYVAWSAPQIKSAANNNGQFDGNNPDIRFSRKDLQPKGFEDYKKSLDRVRKAYVPGAYAVSDKSAISGYVLVSETPAAFKTFKSPLRLGEGLVGTGSTVYLKGSNQHDNSQHNAAIPDSVLDNLPALLADPIAIYDKGSFDRANPRSNSNEDVYLVVLPVKVAGEYVTVAVAPNIKVMGKAVVNFIKSVHTRAPKTLNLYTKHMMYDGISGRNEKAPDTSPVTMSGDTGAKARNESELGKTIQDTAVKNNRVEAPTSPEQFLDLEPRGSQSSVAVTPATGTDLNIRQAKGVDKPRSREDVIALSRKAAPDYTDRINKIVELADSRNAPGGEDMLPGTVYDVVFGREYNNADLTDPAVAKEVYLAVTASLEANGFTEEVRRIEKGIALSRKPGANPPPAEERGDAAARVAQDKFNRFRVLQDWLKENGVNLSEDADVYLAETLMSGRIATRKEDFRNDVMGPLVKKTQKAGIAMNDIADFLKMQHAQEANKRAREIQQKPDATAFGVSDKEAKAALAAFRQRPDFAQLQAIANEWREITRKSKDILLKGGILSPEMAQAWDDTYSFYIPVKGTDEEAAAKTGTGKGLNVNGKTKMRLGHELRDEAIIENILRDHERAISLDEKNKVGKALIKFALEAQNEDIVTVGKPVLRKVLKQGDTAYMVTYHGSDIAVFDSYKDAQAYISQAVLKAGNPSSGTKLGYAIDKTNDNVRVMLQASPMLAANEVNVYVAGRAVRVQINDEIAARAYTNLGVEHLNSILSASREVNNWLSKVYTGYSPDFILTNPIRDAIQGAITLTGELGGLSTAKIFGNYPLAMKELAKFYTTGKSQLVRDYRANGGSTGGAYLSDLERIGDDIQASYEEYSGMLKTYKLAYEKAIDAGKSKKAAHSIATMRSGLTGFKKIPVIGHFLKLMEKLNAMTENALRVATFHTLVQNGMTPQRAAAQAKNLMNFNRKGEKANMAGALYLFYNPNVQGTTLIKRALFDAPHKNQARALAGSMVLAAMAVAALNLGGDDEDKKKWEQTPDYIKDGNIVVIRGDKQITITLPYGYRVFWTLGNVISDAHQGKDLDKLSVRMASSVFGNFSPFGNPLEGKEGPFQLVPTSAKMILGPTMDEDSFGRQIAPTKYAQSEPDSQNMNRATEGTMYAKVAEKLNSLSGGSAYEKGAADVSPEVLKFWVKSLTGGTGQFAMDMVNIGTAATQGAGPGALREVPVIRRFVRDIGVSDARSAYWDRANEAKEIAGQLSLARKAKDFEALEGMMDSNGELAIMAKYAEGMLKVANSKRDAYDAIRKDDTIPLKEKRVMMREIEAEEKAIYDEFIAEFDSTVKKK